MLYRLLTGVVLMLHTSMLLANTGGGIDEKINQYVAPVSNAIGAIVFYSVNINGVGLPLVVVWLILAATFFTFYFKFINFRAMKHGLELVRGVYSDPKAAGEVSHFQALATALSGTVGLGNIAGVAIAVSLGGPGATFWMILAGLLGMSSKFVECTLGVKYRNINPDGSVSGGPMYYLKKGLAERGHQSIGKIIAVFFAICCIGGSIGGGNMFQVNQAYQQVVNVTGGPVSFFADKGWLFGVIAAMLVGLVIIGGIKSIARVTEKVVPIMGLIYVLTGLVVVLMNIEMVPDAFKQILVGAFSPDGVTGGFIGVLILGFRRAAFSNEAGVGSAAIAHSAVRTNYPVTEGFVALFEPFVDTVIVCTITALVIIITNTYDPTAATGGVELTSRAFASAIPWFPYVLALAVVLFAFSTMISWFYYGVKSWTFLVGESKNNELVYKLIFLTFVVIGASMNLHAVVEFSDAMIFAMSVPNVIGLYILAPVVKRELDKYWAQYKAGTLPKFDNS